MDRMERATLLGQQADQIVRGFGFDPDTFSIAALEIQLIAKFLTGAKVRALCAASLGMLRPEFWPDESAHWTGVLGAVRAKTVKRLADDGYLQIKGSGARQRASLSPAGDLCLRLAVDASAVP